MITAELLEQNFKAILERGPERPVYIVSPWAYRNVPDSVLKKLGITAPSLEERRG